MRLLTVGNPKTVKGEKFGYLTFILHLAPANLSGYNVCPMSSEGCRAVCLNTAGRGGIMKPGETTNIIQKARLRRTKLFFENRKQFLTDLFFDIIEARKYALRRDLIPVYRLNGTSDIRWETMTDFTGMNLMERFNDLQFYDYTKIANRRDIPKNYHLTFSRSESNEAETELAFQNGMNVAVVFNKIPNEWNGRPVVNGDESDLRFLDPAGVYVGLKAKGKARKDSTSNFVVNL